MIYHRAQICALCTLDSDGNVLAIVGFTNGTPIDGVSEGQACLPLAARRMPGSGHWLPDVEVPAVLLTGSGDAPVRKPGKAWTLRMNVAKTQAEMLAGLNAELHLLGSEKVRLQALGLSVEEVDVRIKAKKAEIAALKE